MTGLLSAHDAGFAEGDRAPCTFAPGILVVSRDDGPTAGVEASRLAGNLVTIRNDQVT
jgi:hypothetical protein